MVLGMRYVAAAVKNSRQPASVVLAHDLCVGLEHPCQPDRRRVVLLGQAREQLEVASDLALVPSPQHGGLIRHYWVLIKLILTIFVVVVLWLQLGNIRLLASLPPETLLAAGWATTKFSMVLHSGGGLAVLLGATILSVYKPAGLTRYGWNRRYGSAVAPDLMEPDREGPESA